MASVTSDVTVLYYNQNDLTTVCTDVLTDLTVSSDKRVLLSPDYRDDKIIIAVFDGHCQLRNALGDRTIFPNESKRAS
ncbi:DUF2375 family protein [Thalassotalea maritima]|uniref:DUF2375 family protein n=1 Tax=Thalassotalea maritima TaxID=3242416 RepID=UPI00352952EB